jgi:multidrug efflux pump subunit AcrB
MNSLISWFARNSVASNLLMMVIIVGGAFTLTTLRQEVFPEASSDMVIVTVPYPGASPEEVEDGIVVRIEERIQDLEGIERITSTSSESVGTVRVEALEGTDARRLLEDVKARIDAIDTFPADAEEPVVTELVIRRQVINVAISGDAPESTLRRLGERVRDDIVAIPGITQVELSAVRPYEITIEVSEDVLRRFGLTFDFVATAVRRSSLDLPAGSIRTSGGEVLIRTVGQAYTGREFEDIVLTARPDGSRVRVADVARVVDGFAETDQSARFDGKPAVLVQVFRVGEQDALDVAGKVKSYVEEATGRMPEGISLTMWQDDTLLLESRRDLLLRNGRMGLGLVLLVLALFLRFRLAAWVAAGIPISFLGAIWLLPSFDISINLLSLFAFIIVLGIVVDDAIVVGENINSHLERGKPPLKAAIDGAQEVALPVVFSVLTTIAAFSPLLLVGGTTGRFMRAVPIIVVATLFFSIVESLFVLPSHLSHLKAEKRRAGLGGAWTRVRQRVAAGLQYVIGRWYEPSLRRALDWRYATVAGSARGAHHRRSCDWHGVDQVHLLSSDRLGQRSGVFDHASRDPRRDDRDRNAPPRAQRAADSRGAGPGGKAGRVPPHADLDRGAALPNRAIAGPRRSRLDLRRAAPRRAQHRARVLGDARGDQRRDRAPMAGAHRADSGRGGAHFQLEPLFSGRCREHPADRERPRRAASRGGGSRRSADGVPRCI